MARHHEQVRVLTPLHGAYCTLIHTYVYVFVYAFVYARGIRYPFLLSIVHHLLDAVHSLSRPLSSLSLLSLYVLFFILLIFLFFSSSPSISHSCHLNFLLFSPLLLSERLRVILKLPRTLGAAQVQQIPEYKYILYSMLFFLNLSVSYVTVVPSINWCCIVLYCILLHNDA